MHENIFRPTIFLIKSFSGIVRKDHFKKYKKEENVKRFLKMIFPGKTVGRKIQNFHANLLLRILVIRKIV